MMVKTIKWFLTKYLFYLNFKGDFINGKRHGQGREYYLKENSYYEGEFFDNYRVIILIQTVRIINFSLK